MGPRRKGKSAKELVKDSDSDGENQMDVGDESTHSHSNDSPNQKELVSQTEAEIEEQLRLEKEREQLRAEADDLNNYDRQQLSRLDDSDDDTEDREPSRFSHLPPLQLPLQSQVDKTDSDNDFNNYDNSNENDYQSQGISGIGITTTRKKRDRSIIFPNNSIDNQKYDDLGFGEQMLVQLPSNFQIDSAMDGIHASASGHEVDLTNESSSSSSETTDQFTQRKIRKLEPGRIGTVQILESGRMLIKLPGTAEEPEPRVYEASEGLRAQFLQQLAVIEVYDSSSTNNRTDGDEEDENHQSGSSRRGRSRSNSAHEEKEKKPGAYLSHLHEDAGVNTGAAGRTRSRSRTGSVDNAMDVERNDNSSSRIVVKKENGRSRSNSRDYARSNAVTVDDNKEKEKDKEINGNLFLLKKVQRKLVFTERI